ncbi:restriction endonuclease subunit S [Amycolatopsis sp. cg5]|uniref:restriction endonuclease subunit S n=1 Tax=Amycolatopsis sp. cg5 TaxID=3238802 RepID=UPI003523ED7A
MTLGLGADSGDSRKELPGGGAGELPRGWARVTLGDLGVDVQPGFASGKHNRDGDGIVHLRPMNITRNGAIDLSDVRYVDDESDRRIEYGDVLFNNTNSPALVGKTAWVDSLEPVAYSNHMTRLRGPNALDGKFLAIQLHYLWASGYFKTVLNNHVNQASVSRKVLLDTEIMVPPLAEQRRIVVQVEQQINHIEAGEDALIEATRRASDLRSSIADTTISQHSNAPWERLQDLLSEPLRNGVSAKATTDGTGIRTLTLTAVTRNDFSSQFTKTTSADPNRIKNLWLEDQDIFVQRSNSAELVGTSAIYRGENNWAIYPDLLIRVRVDQTRVLPEYAALALRTNRIRFHFRQNARGLSGSMPKIDQAMIANVDFPVPSLRQQREAIEWVMRQEAAIAPLAASVGEAQTESTELRAALLNAAFSGSLVPQSPSDEPASALLDRIRAAREASHMRDSRKPRSAPSGQEELFQ